MGSESLCVIFDDISLRDIPLLCKAFRGIKHWVLNLVQFKSESFLLDSRFLNCSDCNLHVLLPRNYALGSNQRNLRTLI